MWFGTAAITVFALGQVGVTVGMFRLYRERLPATPEGRSRAKRILMPPMIVWMVCALTAAALIVVGDPRMLVFMGAIVLFGGIIVATAFVVGRRMDRDRDAVAVESADQ